jgi:hypothetical protein
MSPPFVTGYEPTGIANGLQFTTVNQSVGIPDAVLANGPLQDFTVEIWANTAYNLDGDDSMVSLADSNLLIVLDPSQYRNPGPSQGGWLETELWSAHR